MIDYICVMGWKYYELNLKSNTFVHSAR